MKLHYTHKPAKKALARFSKRWKKGTLGQKILTSLALLFAGSFLFGLATFAWFSKDLPNPNKLMSRAIPLSTKIYDRTGTHLLYDIHGTQQRTLVSLKDIPDSVKWATIATEDKKFYQHQGFDLKGIARAIVVDVMKGSKAQGGSTITQQFIKNSIVGNKKTLTRKVKELVLSYQLERNFTKDEILQLYFNEIPYGSTAYGIQSASTIYFGKDIKDLTLAESAILAALPKAPTFYSPWGNNKDQLIARQHRVLNDMVSEGYIEEEAAEAAKKEKLKFTKPGQAIKAPHFVMYIRDILTEAYGEKMVEEGGLKVLTTLDWDKQQAAEEAITRGDARNATYKATNASLVSIDAKTGEILAMVGSKDYFNEEIDGNVNVALKKRQPGSSFKPIAYAAAFEKGYTPDTILFDIETDFDTTEAGEYRPRNYNGRQHGPVTMKKALAGSLNIPAVKALYLTGVPRVIEFANRLNYTTLTDPARYGLALVLGGAEVTLLEHTSSFSAFARDGNVVKPIGIMRIEDRTGAVLEEFEKPVVKKAFDEEVARQINEILSTNAYRAYVFGDRNHLTLGGRPVAAKTGTTNDFRDAWTVGYTPSLVTGVWVGNNNNSAMRTGADGSQIAAPIWNEYMRKALADSPIEQFTKPKPVVTEKAVLNGSLGNERKVKVDSITGKLASEFTPPDQVIEKTYVKVHTILHYVDKTNPRGPLPENPEQDSQYWNWERGVRAWVEKNNIEEGEPPTETDDVHTQENTPTISILSPQENDTITQQSTTVTVNTTAPRGVKMVEYYIDDTLAETSSTAPFSATLSFAGIENGFHAIKALVFDDVGNTASSSVTVNVLIGRQPSQTQQPVLTTPSVVWQSPANGAVIQKSSGATNLSLSILNQKPGGKLVINYTSLLQSGTISTLSDPAPSTTVAWQLPNPGRYTLTAQLYDVNGSLVNQKRIIVKIQ